MWTVMDMCISDSEYLGIITVMNHFTYLTIVKLHQIISASVNIHALKILQQVYFVMEQQ